MLRQRRLSSQRRLQPRHRRWPQLECSVLIRPAWRNSTVLFDHVCPIIRPGVGIVRVFPLHGRHVKDEQALRGWICIVRIQLHPPPPQCPVPASYPRTHTYGHPRRPRDDPEHESTRPHETGHAHNVSVLVNQSVSLAMTAEEKTRCQGQSVVNGYGTNGRNVIRQHIHVISIGRLEPCHAKRRSWGCRVSNPWRAASTPPWCRGQRRSSRPC